MPNPIVGILQRSGILAISENADARLLERSRDGDIAGALLLAALEVLLCAGNDGARTFGLDCIETWEVAAGAAAGRLLSAALEVSGARAEARLAG